MKTIDTVLGVYLGSGVIAVLLTIAAIYAVWAKYRGLSFREMFTRVHVRDTEPMTLKDWAFLAGWIILWPVVEVAISYGMCTKTEELLKTIDVNMEII